MSREDRQYLMDKWVRETFGKSPSPPERALRLLEEAAELCQVEGVDLVAIRNTLAMVYAKPCGEARQEVGGISVCLLAYCAVKGLDADECEEDELERLLRLPADHFRVRQAAKDKLGASALTVERAGPPTPRPDPPPPDDDGGIISI